MKVKNENPSKDEPDSQLTEVTVFYGSSSEDIEHAKSFWKSLTLQPPLESRLVSADIRQRLRVAKPRAKKQAKKLEGKELAIAENELFLRRANEKEKMDERARYRLLAQQREAVLDLLHKQRCQRIQKEQISRSCR